MIITAIILPIPTIITAELEEKTPFVFGMTGPITNFDPVIIKGAGEAMPYYYDNVVEMLFAVNESDRTEIIGELAESSTWLNRTTADITIREGIYFHDGTPFNASAAKWNVDRMFNIAYENPIYTAYEILYIDADPYRDYFVGGPKADLIDNSDWDLSWVPAEGDFAFINRTELIDEFTLRIHCNGFSNEGALEAFLSINWMGMFSPTYYTSNEMEAWEGHDSLVSTGPFKFLYHDSVDGEGKIVVYENYWKAGSLYLDEVIYIVFETDSVATTTMLTGEIDYTIAVSDVSAINDSEMVNLIVGPAVGSMEATFMNNLNVNATIREALSFAFDYDNYIDYVKDGLRIRAGGVIPYNSPFYNDAIPLASFNITRARKVLIDAGISQGLTLESNNEDWVFLANSGNPIAEFNDTHSTPYWTGTVDAEIAAGERIGIKINRDARTSTWVGILQGPGRADLDLYHIPIMSDAYDPSAELAIWYHSTSNINFAYVDDPEIDEWIILAGLVGDFDTKYEIISNITDKLQNEIYPFMYLTHEIRYAALSADWEGDTGSGLDLWCQIVPASEPTPESPVIPGYSLDSISIIIILGVTMLIIAQRKKIRR